MHIWVVEEMLDGGEWESYGALSRITHRTRERARFFRRLVSSALGRTRIRKYIPEPSLEDFDRWFEGEYGTRHLYEEYADLSDIEVTGRLVYGGGISFESERDHRNEWDRKREIALSAFKAMLSLV